MPALHHRSCWSWMHDPTLPQWPTVPRGVAVSVKVSSSLYLPTPPQSSHRRHFSWVETCWCTAVPWVISCHAAMTQHMTSKCSGFSLADLILAPEEHQAGRFEGLVESKGLFIWEATNHSLLCLSLFASLKRSFLAAFSCRAHAVGCWIKPAASPPASLHCVASPARLPFFEKKGGL